MGASWPLRSFESLVTAVYQYEIRGGWTLQPNFQYIIHPGGGATNPLGGNPGRQLKDAAVLGVRTVLKF
jgi:porin